MHELMFRWSIALFGNGSVYIAFLVNVVTYVVIRMLIVGGPGAFKLCFFLLPEGSSVYILFVYWDT